MDGMQVLWRVDGSLEVTQREAHRIVCRRFGVELPSTGR
jgi:hypothetical protein